MLYSMYVFWRLEPTVVASAEPSQTACTRVFYGNYYVSVGGGRVYCLLPTRRAVTMCLVGSVVRVSGGGISMVYKVPGTAVINNRWGTCAFLANFCNRVTEKVWIFILYSKFQNYMYPILSTNPSIELVLARAGGVSVAGRRIQSWLLLLLYCTTINNDM